MSSIDWIVLVVTLAGIIAYGLYKSRTSKNLEGYFLSNRSMPWYLVLLSIMGTQASAVTFLSAPGQAFTDGMRFVQYYFGLPLAMVVLCITFVPLFNRLKLFTAYEFLEQRFDLKTRTFTSFLFLLSRGLSTGISIYAPSIILSSLMGWDIFWTNLVMGGVLIIYTVTGGARAVAYTQQLQLVIIFTGMLIAGYLIVHYLPEGVGFTDALKVSGASGKLNVITTGISEKGFDWKDRYNLISGVIGGFFLALSYFGTDQSQVGRYLTAKDTTESRLGLLMNGLVKVPMQFFILLLGALLFTFYQFNPAPVFFNKAVEERAMQTPYRDSLQVLKNKFDYHQAIQQQWSRDYTIGKREELKDSIGKGAAAISKVQQEYRAVLKKAVPGADNNDTNYIFLRFVVDFLPTGLIGLLIAIIFLAAWGSIAAALNSLASCTMVDFHLRLGSKKGAETGIKTDAECRREYRLSKYYTLAWGVFCVMTAELASGMGSLIEAVNVLGSLFYGVILGIFLVAFYMKKVQSAAVFTAAIVGEILVIAAFIMDKYNIIGLGFLWLNVLGAVAVVLLAWVLQQFPFMQKTKTAPVV
ncbi:sodium:solute symporter [Sediminibacterium ginsengisoli]|uniref:Transporter, SSS family n=1 Tax=Sediminibacterium ginsengisoli TaxID=413434 RepID=A0A1T4QRW0_9BACT|nr:sodium:solute symporter [Sediminibacterium ginsengisoli]SKA06406.1 transporter, SSS family [Sediminibacterium ginsengisoli]